MGLAFGAMGIALFIQTVIQMFIGMIGMAVGNPKVGTNPWGMAISILISAAGVVGFIALLRVDLRPSLRMSLPSPIRSLPSILLLTIAGWIVSMQVGMTTENLFPMPQAIADMFAQLLDRKQPAGLLIAIVVAAPIAEEFLCRGLLLPALQRRWGTAVAIVVSALAFGALHMNPWQFFYAALLGVTLGWLRVQSGSILPGILLHALNNFLSWVVLIHPGTIPRGKELVEKTLTEVPTTWLLLAAVLYPVGLLLLGRPTEEAS